MSESKLAKEMTKNLKQIIWSNVESGMTSPGFPDYHYILPGGKEGTIELKYIHEDNKKRLIRPQQISWWRAKAKQGGKVLLLAHVDFEENQYYCLYNNMDQITTIAMSPSPLDWMAISEVWWTDQMDWPALYKLYL